MNVIEKVARALCDDTMSRWRSPIALQDEPWREFIPAAKAAIEAMKDPSMKMLDAGWSITEFAYDAYSVMINTALKEKKDD